MSDHLGSESTDDESIQLALKIARRELKQAQSQKQLRLKYKNAGKTHPNTSGASVITPQRFISRQAPSSTPTKRRAPQELADTPSKRPRPRTPLPPQTPQRVSSLSAEPYAEHMLYGSSMPAFDAVRTMTSRLRCSVCPAVSQLRSCTFRPKISMIPDCSKQSEQCYH